MPVQHILNIELKGISACVPKTVVNNLELELLGSPLQRQRYVDTTGVRRRHIVKRDETIRASDLTFEAANLLINELNWKREEIDCLVFVSQTSDYILPATACILQHRLGLTNDCFAMDISLGCSGWIYGLTTLAALMQNGNYKKGLLLAGDTSTLTKSSKDKSTYPLFGDAGTATAIEFDAGNEGIKTHTATDGKNHDAIMIPDGGFRNMYNDKSIVEEEFDEGIVRTRLDTIMDGPAVYTFGITKVPRSIRMLSDTYGINLNEIDYYVFHQANKMMIEKIVKKLKVPLEKVPLSLDEYGNTSSSSIPLTIVTRLRQELAKQKLKIIACGFGVGLSWGSIYFEANNLVVPALKEI